MMRLTKHTLEILAATFLFQGLTSEEILRVVENYSGQLLTFAATESVFEAESDYRRLGIVIRGRTSVRMPIEGTQVLMSELTEGSILGAAGMFYDGVKTVTTVTAIKQTVVLFFSEEELKRMLHEDERLMTNYLAYLTKRIHFLTDRIGSIASTNPENKLISYLMTNSDNEGRVVINRGLSALASSLSISRASLYRAIAALTEQGRIKREGKTIYILGVNEK